MITITRSTPLYVISDGVQVIYNGLSEFANGFDIENGVASYYNELSAPVTSFNIGGSPITSTQDFLDALEALTA